MDVQEAVEGFLMSRETRRKEPETQKAYKESLQSCFLAFCKKAGIRTLEELIPPPNANENKAKWAFVDFLKAKGNNMTTIKFRFKIVKILANYWGTSLINSERRELSFSYKQSKEEMDALKQRKKKMLLTASDVKQMLEYRFYFKGHKKYPLHVRNHLMIRILSETGIRIGELAKILVSDVDTDKNRIHIRKSKTEARHVPVSPITMQVYRAYIQQNNLSGDDRLFPDDSQISQIVAEVYKGLCIDAPGKGAHALRHYFASYAHYVRGMSLDIVARIMGDTEDIIKSTYLHLPEEVMAEYVNEKMGWGKEK